MPDFSLFNSADDCLAHSLDDQVFDESLILNILFQEGLLVHEAYFFNSTLLAKHVERAIGRPSLFELAAQRGLIIPAFRSTNSVTLDDAYENMKHVYGESYVLLHPQMQPFKDRVVASVNVGIQKTEPFYWPSNERSLGEGYQEVIAALLQTDSPPVYSYSDPGRRQLLHRVWEISKPWRFDNVDEAIQLTKAKGGLGLQRTELFCSVGWSVGIPRNVVTIFPSDIIDRCTTDEDKLAMEIFLKWVTQCHHVNQAKSFQTAINFPVYNLDQDFIIDTLLRSPLDSPPTQSEGFRCAVELPPLDALVAADPSELVAIRSDLGLGYLHALSRWQESPTEDNQESVAGSLREYAAQICARYDVGIRQTLLASVTRGGSSPWGEVAELAGSVTGMATGVPFGVFSQLRKTVTTLYKYVRRNARNTRLSPRKRELEITLPDST